jgi:hypothetical protein
MRNWEDLSDVWSTGKWNEWGNVVLHVELVPFQRRRWCFDRRRFIFLFVFLKVVGWLVELVCVHIASLC